MFFVSYFIKQLKRHENAQKMILYWVKLISWVIKMKLCWFIFISCLTAIASGSKDDESCNEECKCDAQLGNNKCDPECDTCGCDYDHGDCRHFSSHDAMIIGFTIGGVIFLVVCCILIIKFYIYNWINLSFFAQ
ncbi:unnamed protein product [Blepharisma stoltei]|uniref:Uncharacterized protein n=1 Tax=Blepharisma stoltei TaxID=1481888 RepID=A0AAU9JBL1_9CILI|nr:unnamed protein product [Blepharisma stoltei]